MAVDTEFEQLVRRAVRAELAELLPHLKPVAPAPRGIEGLLTTKQIAKMCGNVETETVQSWCRSGELVGRKAKRRWVVRREDLERFLVDHRSVSRPAAPSDVAADVARKVRAAGGRR